MNDNLPLHPGAILVMVNLAWDRVIRKRGVRMMGHGALMLQINTSMITIIFMCSMGCTRMHFFVFGIRHQQNEINSTVIVRACKKT